MWFLFIILTFSQTNISTEYYQGIEKILVNASTTPFIGEIVSGNIRQGQTPGWFNLGMVGLVIGFLLVTLLNFSASFLNSPRLKAMANVEMKEFGFSFLILLGLLAFMYLMDEIFINITQSSSNPYIYNCNSSGCVYNYVRDIIKDNFDIFKNMVLESVKAAAGKYKEGGKKEGFKFEWPGFVSFGATYLSGFTPYATEEQYYNLGVYILTLAAGIASFSYGLMQILGPLFISIGVFLRPLPFFRKLGATMLALGIGFFFILPSVFVLLYSFPPSLGLSYNTGECPEICRIDIVAFDNQKGLTYQEAYSKLLQADNSLDSITINSFLDGNKQKEMYGVTSCEYIDNNLNPIYGLTPEILTKGKRIGLNMEKCPKICRKVPYPIDNPLCYFSQSACAKLYDESNGKCFIKLYDLNVLDLDVRLSNGVTKKLRDYIRDTNCTKLLPIRPSIEDYNIYCPLSCRGYYNTIIWGMFTEEEIERMENGNKKDVLDIVNQGQGQQLTREFLDLIRSDDTIFQNAIKDIIDKSIKQVWAADILITCGAMYGVTSEFCYNPNNYNHPIKAIYSAIKNPSITDNDLRIQINTNYGSPRGDKAVNIRSQTKPPNEINNYPIFYQIYGEINFNTDEQTILEKFKDKYFNYIKNNYNSINFNSDENINGWRVRFGNIWETSCLDEMEEIIKIKRNEINDITTDRIIQIGECSEIIGNAIDQFVKMIKEYVKALYWAYGVCNPFEDFGLDCKYSDKSLCADITICNSTYSTKTEERPSKIWRDIKNSYFDGVNNDFNLMENLLSKVYLPIYPKEQDCSLSSTIDPDMLRFPPSPDCSGCSTLNFFENQNYLFSYVGAAIFRMITLPLIAIFITFVSIISLSEYLGGEIFLPGLSKVR